MADLELAFQKEVIKWLNKHKIYHFRTQMGNKSGLPDIICCINGIFVGLELKRPDGKGKPTKQQEKICKDINDIGGVGLFVTSIDTLQDLCNYLNTNKELERFIYEKRKIYD